MLLKAQHIHSLHIILKYTPILFFSLKQQFCTLSSFQLISFHCEEIIDIGEYEHRLAVKIER